MAVTYLDDSGYTLGMIRDLPSWLIPSGGVYDSLNYVYDLPGIARQRMGSTALVSGSQTAFSESLGFVYSQDGVSTIEELYGCGTAATVSVINKSTGASTSLVTLGKVSVIGRPARHFGFLVFPLAEATTAFYRSMIVAGQTSSTTFTSTAAVNITAGAPQITLGGADTTTNLKVGGIIHATNTTTASFDARIISIDTSTKFTVWPTPTLAFATAAAGLFGGPAAVSAGIDTQSFGGACATSFQNRLLYGGVNDPAVATITRYDRRVLYSPLPTETGTFATTVGGATGAIFLGANRWPALNYFDVPGADPIVAMEPIAGNQLLILTSTHPVIFSGDLVTQLATTSPTVTFDISDINVNASCLSDLSVQRTPKGVVWAGAGGIYAWDGRSPVDLTSGSVNAFWRAQVRGSSFAVHGAVYVRGYYILSYTSGGTTQALAADLTGKTPKWTRMNGVGTDNFFGVARPTDPSQVFAIRWWNTGGAAPSMTNGQTLRLESMLNPYTAGATTTDADGTGITTNLQTRTITGDPELQKVFHRVTARTQVSATSASATLTAQSTIDAADTDASRTRALGSLSNTATITLTNATNASPIVCTSSANHGLQTDDFVDIDAVLGNLNANGRYRINVSNATTFSLVGSTGSAAYTSGGKVKKITEQDYLCATLNEGQGVSLTVAATVNNIEIHGFRIACEQREPVMSA